MVADRKAELNVVIAVDESKESRLACDWVCRKFLSRFQSSSMNLTLLHVQQDLVTNVGCWDLKTNSKTVLDRGLAICRHYNVKAETHVVIGWQRQYKICEAVQSLGADLLVMGSHGHCAFVREFKGSVSDYCFRNATCPVLVITKEKYASTKP